MKDRMNVLSIDWDYFINASIEERLRLFPDGGNENFSYEIQNMIWLGRYMNDELVNIKTDTNAIRKLKKVLKRQFGVLFMITDSHRYAYDFVNMHYNDLEFSGINLVNVDFHHDVYPNGDHKVDCGNWLAKLIERYKDTDSKFTWVARHDSDMDLGVSLHGEDKLLECIEDLGIISEYQWDLVFICRSGMWSPPHLDRSFVNAFKFIKDEFAIQYEKDIFKDRYSSIRKDVEKLKSEKGFSL